MASNPQKNLKKTSSGFGLLEALVDIALVGMVMGSIISLMTSMMKAERQAEISSDYAIIRNQVMTQIMDYRAWSNLGDNNPTTVLNNVNGSTPVLNCLVNQTSCTPLIGSNLALDIYDANGGLVFKFSDPSMGFSPSAPQVSSTASSAMGGATCTGVGTALCPLRLNLSTNPICPAVGSCVNPTFKISGGFTYYDSNSGGTIALPNLSFNIYKSNVFCPTQTEPQITITGPASSGASSPIFSNYPYPPPFGGSSSPIPPQPPTPFSINNTQAANSSSPTGVVTMVPNASSSPAFLPCRDFHLQFNDNMPTVAPIAPKLLTDPGNQSDVCIYNPANPGVCIYQYHRQNLTTAAGTDTVTLNYAGANGSGAWATPQAVPNTWSINSGTTFEFRVKNGLVQFCGGSSCYTPFDGILDFPFAIQFTPAGSDYSPAGFSNIKIWSADP